MANALLACRFEGMLRRVLDPLAEEASARHEQILAGVGAPVVDEGWGEEEPLPLS